MLVQGTGRNQVHQKTDCSNNEHRYALHLFGLKQSSPGLVENTKSNQKNRSAIDERGEYLRPMPAEGPGVGRRISGKLDGRQGEEQGKKVKEYVGGVGKKGKRIGPDTPGNLCQKGDYRQSNGVFKPAGYALVQVQFGVHRFNPLKNIHLCIKCIRPVLLSQRKSVRSRLAISADS